MSDRALLAPWNPAPTSSRDYYMARGFAFLGGGDLWSSWDDFDNRDVSGDLPAGWQPDLAGGTGSMTNSASSECGGIHFASTGAVAGQRYNLRRRDQLFNPGTKNWYVALKMQVNGIDATSVVGAFLTDNTANQSIGIGILGSGSATNWVLQYNGLAISNTGSVKLLGAADTAYHVFEMWGIGTTVSACIDGGAVQTQTGVITGGSDKCGLWINCYNGANAANRTREVSWLLAMGQR